MRKIIAVMATMAVIVGVSAGAAFAGEVTGNGKPLWTNTDDWTVEHHTLHGQSACAFSGQEDDQFEASPDYSPNAPHSQSWGQIVQSVATLGGVADLAHEAGTPGMACNPTSGFEE